jgi:hypothetical protein
MDVFYFEMELFRSQKLCRKNKKENIEIYKCCAPLVQLNYPFLMYFLIHFRVSENIEILFQRVTALFEIFSVAHEKF